MFNRGWEYIVTVFGVYKTHVSGWLLAIVAIGLSIASAFFVDDPSKSAIVVRWSARLTSFSALWLILVAQYDTWRKEKDKADDATMKLAAINNGRPRLKLKEPGAIYIETVRQSATSGSTTYTQTAPFLKLRLVNDPVESFPSAHARDLRAKIDFRRCSDGVHVLSIDGRWAESDQPSAISPLASKAHLLGADFGIGEEKSLDIAYYDKRTSAYYAWNNDNYNYEYFTFPHHLLDGNHFQVDIRIRGEWVDEHITFQFIAQSETFQVIR